MSGSFLFPDLADRMGWDDRLTALLAAAEERMTHGPVAPTIDVDALRTDLVSFDFHEPRPFGDLLSWTIDQMEHGLVHLNHPRYLGLFNPAPTFPSQVADRIVATFNPQLATATTSPAAVEIEAHVTRSIARRVGLGAQAVGHFTSGGSEANYTALVCALTQSNPDFATFGSRAFSGQPTFYISNDSHLAWIKIAHQAGIGRVAARLVATDGTGRMSADALAEAVEADRAIGCVPVMVVATAGTTNAGMIDPLQSCAEIARGAGLWYHVDAAWGGALIASTRLCSRLAGIEKADSVTIDAHKWFATTMGCGIFLTRHAPMLSAAFNVSASYMPSNVATRDPYMMTAQWSRRFLGLRLFLSLAAAGWAGYAALVERAIELIDLLRENVEKRGWSVVNEPSLAVACMTPPPGSRQVRDIVKRAVSSGGTWVSVAIFEGREVVRACVTHGGTTPADIVAVAHVLEEARRG
jgi:glutamate/tyrosine decarboxylase-like PLP-dependent enzyme